MSERRIQRSEKVLDQIRKLEKVKEKRSFTYSQKARLIRNDLRGWDFLAMKGIHLSEG